MINYVLKLKRRFKNRLQVYSNVKRAIMRQQTKFIVKFNNSNKHFYIRLFELQNNKPIITIHTIALKKDSSNIGMRTRELIPKLVDNFLQQVSNQKITLNQNNIIWDLNYHRHQGRIRLAISIISNKIQS